MRRPYLHLVYGCLLLLAIALSSVVQPLRSLIAWAQLGCQTFPQTGQTVCGKFLSYWNAHGGLAQQGYPIGPELREISELDGQEYTVQYFERAVFELHPENQPPYDVLLSQLGTYQARSRYGTPPAWKGALPPERHEIAPGISVTLVPSSSNDIRPPWNTGVDACRGGVMTWVLRLENASNVPYTAMLDPGYHMVDSTGKEYRTLQPGCHTIDTTGVAGPFAQGPWTVQPTHSSELGITLNANGLPITATFLELRLNISGTPLIFRYALR